jgi:hypothetical protein
MTKQWIAKRRIGRTRAGEPIRVPGAAARALVALGYIAEAPPEGQRSFGVEAPRAALLTPKRDYKRRDMAPAATKAPQAMPAPITPTPVPVTPVVAPDTKPTPVTPPWHKPTTE